MNKITYAFDDGTKISKVEFHGVIYEITDENLMELVGKYFEFVTNKKLKEIRCNETK